MEFALVALVFVQQLQDVTTNIIRAHYGRPSTKCTFVL